MRWLISRSSRVAAVLAGTMVLVLGGTTGAQAAVIPNGTYSNWNWPVSNTGFYNFDIRLTIQNHTPGAHLYWAHQFGLRDGDGGYLGLQVGSHPNNTKIALFSIWGANGAEGANCGTFVEGTPGWTCRIDPYDWVTGRTYRLRLWAIGTDPQGEWWGAWVRDTVTGVERQIGAIRVPLAWGWLGDWSVAWTENFGPKPETCPELPWARARFGFPTANNGQVQLASHSHFIGAGDCPAYSRIIEASGGDIQEMGRLA